MDNFELHALKWLHDILQQAGLSEELAAYSTLFIGLLFLAIVSLIVDQITRRLLLQAVQRVVQKSQNQWDDIFLEKKVFSRLGHIAPVVVIQFAAPALFIDFPTLQPIVLGITNLLMIWLVMQVMYSLLNATEYALSKSAHLKDKPIASYFQLAKLIVSIVGGVFILSVILQKEPWYFLSAFGAMTAIILLIFKDTILGLVASVQVAAHDTLRVGDWVEMPKYGADGDVMQITLNNVRIRNFDKTITTIPTYAFITESFKNWRGMQEAGGRRIKRSIYINLNTVRFCTPNMLKRFRKYHLVSTYIEEKEAEITDYNTQKSIDKSELLNGRNLTNVGVFRAYAMEYLRHNEHIWPTEKMTLMVRQLEPTSKGLPIQIYCFTKDTRWTVYEGVQADIFDHLIAAAKHFELEVFQQPAGHDIHQVGELLKN